MGNAQLCRDCRQAVHAEHLKIVARNQFGNGAMVTTGLRDKLRSTKRTFAEAMRISFSFSGSA